MEDCSASKYESELVDFLESYGIVEQHDIEVERRICKGQVVGLKIKKRKAYLSKAPLFINFEAGHVNKDRYFVKHFSYHYNHPEDPFRFDSHHKPHCNNQKKEHLFFGKDLSLDIKGINTLVVLNIAHEFEVSSKYPCKEENSEYYQ